MRGKHKGYQGHRNYNAWNVALWINNTESLYFHALSLCRTHGIGKGADLFFAELEGQSTGDGVPYTRTNVRLALQHITS